MANDTLVIGFLLSETLRKLALQFKSIDLDSHRFVHVMGINVMTPASSTVTYNSFVIGYLCSKKIGRL